MNDAPPSTSLAELAKFFLRLGTTAFGAPAARIAMTEDELVRRRGWLSREKFLDLLGPPATYSRSELQRTHHSIGYLRVGWPGLLVAGCCFIVPAACMVAALAWAYVRFRRLPATSAVLYVVKPVVIAVILQALGDWAEGQ